MVVRRDIITPEVCQNRFGADAPAAQAMAGVQEFVQHFAGNRTRRIELATCLLDDHAQFATEFVGVEGCIAHLIRLKCHQPGRMAHRHRGVVHGAVVRRVGVEGAAERLGALRQFARTERRRTLEEHVLEDVRDPHELVGLVEESGANVADERRGWRGPASLHQQRHAIGKLFAPETVGWRRAHSLTAGSGSHRLRSHRGETPRRCRRESSPPSRPCHDARTPA